MSKRREKALTLEREREKGRERQVDTLDRIKYNN
jgi:hypothetical protein